jgi:hypothetical protein
LGFLSIQAGSEKNKKAYVLGHPVGILVDSKKRERERERERERAEMRDHLLFFVAMHQLLH